jgi:hypothetical protein
VYISERQVLSQRQAVARRKTAEEMYRHIESCRIYLQKPILGQILARGLADWP